MRTLLLFLPLCLVALAQIAPPNAAGVAWGHVHIKTENIQAQKKFWKALFQQDPVRYGPLDVYKYPGGLLLLSEAASSGGTEGSIVDHFGFGVPQLQPVLDRLQAAGGRYDPLKPDAQGAWVWGPDEVKIELSVVAGMQVPLASHHTHLWNNDVPGIKAWYVKTFGAAGGKRAKMEAADLPGMNLTFAVAKHPTVGTKGRVLDHIGFEVKNLEAFCKKLEAAGVKFDVPYKQVPALNISLAFFSDPWGTYIELTEGLDKW
jgi:catechol 2,3-dioxygenase-like lactoylglutathione lyase family enzyme